MTWPRLLTLFIGWFQARFRLFEAIGIALVLSSWFVNWWSVEEWTSAHAEISRKYERIQRAYLDVQTPTNIRLEAAMTREALRQSSSNPSDYNSLVDAVWKSGEVRQYWLILGSNALVAIDFLLSELAATRQLSEFQAKTAALRSMLTDLNKFVENLTGASPEEISLMKKVPIPAPDRFTPRSANELNIATASLVSETLSLVSQIQDHLNINRRNRSRLASLIFLLGSFLAVCAKLSEWRAESQLANQTVSAARRR